MEMVPSGSGEQVPGGRPPLASPVVSGGKGRYPPLPVPARWGNPRVVTPTNMTFQ